MTVYFQETDSRTVIPLPNNVAPYISFRLPNETTGATTDLCSFPLAEVSNMIEPTRQVICNIENPNVAQEAKKLLVVIQDVLTSFRQVGIDMSHLPPIRAFKLDDGAVLIEWIFSDYRVGFSVEPNPEDSGWYLVTKENLGNINASGYTSHVDLKKQMLWLFAYVFSNS